MSAINYKITNNNVKRHIDILNIHYTYIKYTLYLYQKILDQKAFKYSEHNRR